MSLGMNSGRLTVLAILGAALLGGIGLWYSQTRAFYAEVEDLQLSIEQPDGSFFDLTFDPDAASPRAIDGQSSPLKFRACFNVAERDVAGVLERVFPVDTATPLTTPDWFDCFDEAALTEALEVGAARAFLIERNIATGVDRVGMMFPDGRGYAWHQLNGTLE